MKSLLETITEYDYKQQEYIAYLEKENERLRKQASENLDLALKSVETSSRTLLHAIVNGAFDNKNEEVASQASEGLPPGQ